MQLKVYFLEHPVDQNVLGSLPLACFWWQQASGGPLKLDESCVILKALGKFMGLSGIPRFVLSWCSCTFTGGEHKVLSVGEADEATYEGNERKPRTYRIPCADDYSL